MADSSSPTSPRGLAARQLGRLASGERIPDHFSTDPSLAALSLPDRTLCHELTMGVLRNLSLLDDVLGRYCRRPLRHLDPLLVNILRIGAYQLLYLQRVPAYAAVNEAVRDARRSGFSRQAGFVNAILRQIERNGPPAEQAAARPADAGELAVRYSHPVFLVERWLGLWEKEAVRNWLERSNQPPAHYLALNTARITMEEFLSCCQDRQLEARPALSGTPLLEWRDSPRLAEPFLSRGLAYWQDIWSHAVTAGLPSRAYGKILDLCAAPGGKSFSLALRFPAARLVAADLSPERLAAMQKRAALLGLPAIHYLAADARHSPLPEKEFDLVLVDAPCSGTGTLQKNPELRWRLQPEEIIRQARRQRDIMGAAARLVAPGGDLAYATCSAEPEENEQVVQSFLVQQQGKFSLVQDAGWLAAWKTANGCFRSFPLAGCGEGLFCALLRRE